jgi:hypothetical protein
MIHDHMDPESSGATQYSSSLMTNDSKAQTMESKCNLKGLERI